MAYFDVFVFFWIVEVVHLGPYAWRQIIKNFENRGNVRLKDFVGKVRKYNNQLVWLHDDHSKALKLCWANKVYKKLYEKAQKVRLGDP